MVNIVAVTHHIRTVRELRAGKWLPGRISTGAVILAIVLAAAGVGMGVYLIYLG
jgi:hypothetical protein